LYNNEVYILPSSGPHMEGGFLLSVQRGIGDDVTEVVEAGYGWTSNASTCDAWSKTIIWVRLALQQDISEAHHRNSRTYYSMVPWDRHNLLVNPILIDDNRQGEASYDFS
jgi:hypothetical protein